MLGATRRKTDLSPVAAMLHYQDKNQADLLAHQLASWTSGIDFELAFWERWMATRGSHWPDEFNARTGRSREVVDWIVADLPDPQSARILDVGSGPITTIGEFHKGVRLQVISVDPLAEFYRLLGERYGIAIDTVTAFAEDLSAYFDLESFDRVHCRNALDHSFDPVRSIEEMLLITKTGGRVFLLHSIDEGKRENYLGFHQWDFTEADGDFLIQNKSSTVNVSRMFSQWCDIVVEAKHEQGTISTIFYKRQQLPFDAAFRYRTRTRALTSAFLKYLASQTRDYHRLMPDDDKEKLSLPEPRVPVQAMFLESIKDFGAGPKNPRERAAWFRGRAEEFRMQAEAAGDDVVQESYRSIASSYSLVADRAEAVADALSREALPEA